MGLLSSNTPAAPKFDFNVTPKVPVVPTQMPASTPIHSAGGLLTKEALQPQGVPVASPQQDIEAKHSVLKDIWDAPANTKLGIIKNTIAGLPEAALHVGKDLGQGIARDIVGVPLALTGKKTSPVPDNPLAHLVFGTEPIPNVYENGKKTMIDMGADPKVASVMGLPFGAMMAITDIYAGPESKGVKALNELSKASELEKSIATHYPTLTEQAPELAQKLSTISDTNETSQVVKDALHKTAAEKIQAHQEEPDLTYEPTHEEGQVASLEKSAAEHQAPAVVDSIHPEQVQGEFIQPHEETPPVERGKFFDKTVALDEPTHAALNEIFHTVQSAADIEPELRRDLPKNITGDKALSEIIDNSRGPDAYDRMEEVANALKSLGYKDSSHNGSMEFPAQTINGNKLPTPILADDLLKAHMALPNESTPIAIPSQYKQLAELARTHTDPQSFVNAVANSPDESLLRDLYHIKKDPIEGSIKTPEQFFEAAKKAPEPVKETHEPNPSDMEENARLQSEATERSLKAMDEMEANQKAGKKAPSTPNSKMKDLGEGTWESIVRGYSRHLPGAKKAHLLDFLGTPEFVLEKVGLQDGAKLLQNAKDIYRINLKKELNRVIEWKKSVEGIPDSSRRIFKYLDGDALHTKSEMTDQEYQVAKDIKKYLKDWAFRLDLPEENQVSNYITHLFEKDADLPEKNVFDDPELRDIMKDSVAKSVYDPFLQRRVNKPEYKQDVWGALDAYVKRGTRKEAMDPALESLAKMAAKLDDDTYAYVADLSHRINMRPTRIDNAIDNLIKESPIKGKLTSRPVANLTSKIRSFFYRGFLGFNISSALRNLSQGANTYAKLGEKYTIIGYGKLFRKMVGKDLGDLYEHGVLDEGFIQDKKVGVYKSLLQKLDPALFGLFETAEKINRGAAFYGAEARGLAKGLSPDEAIQYAKRMVRETQFSFGAVDTPIILSSDIAKTALQMQNYNVKQIEFLKRMIQNKDFGGLLRYAGASALFMLTIGKLFGMTAEQLLPMFSFGPIVKTGGDISTLANPNAKANEKQTALTDLSSTAINAVPGGSQLKKSFQGIAAVNKGGITDSSGKVTAVIPKTPLNYVRGALFGKNAFPEQQDAQAKINTLYQLLNQSKTGQATKQAIDDYDRLKKMAQTQGPDVANTEFAKIKDKSPEEAKLILQQIKNEKLGLTKEDLLVKQLPVNDGTRAKYVAQEFNDLSSVEEKKALWEKYVAAGILTKQVQIQVMPLLKK